jgi:hypothetical protein
MIRGGRAGARTLTWVALRGCSEICAEVKATGADPVAVAEAALALGFDVDVASVPPELRPVVTGLRVLLVVLDLGQPKELLEHSLRAALLVAASAA